MTNTNTELGDRDEGNYNDGQYTLVVTLWQFYQATTAIQYDECVVLSCS